MLPENARGLSKLELEGCGLGLRGPGRNVLACRGGPRDCGRELRDERTLLRRGLLERCESRSIGVARAEPKSARVPEAWVVLRRACA